MMPTPCDRKNNRSRYRNGEKKPPKGFVYKDPPRPPWKSEFDILQNEHQDHRRRSGPPAFGNHFQFTARDFLAPGRVSGGCLLGTDETVAEGCDQMEISAVC